MGKVSRPADQSAVVVSRRRGTKTPGDAKRPETKTVRQQLHLGETTAKRLAVHAALVGRNASRVADEILTSYLRTHGKGREIFDSPDSVDVDDRESGATEERDSEADGAARRGL